MQPNTLYENLKFYGVDFRSLYEEAGEKIAERITSMYPSAKTFTLVLGNAGNATDGVFTGISLAINETFKIKVYLIGRQSNIESVIFREGLEHLKKLPNVTFHNDCYAQDIEQSDVNIEALIGTGAKGDKLNKRFHDVVKRISHFQNPIVAIDMPAFHYTPDLTISLNYPKTYDAEVVKLTNAMEYLHNVGPGDLAEIWNPNNTSHKNKNGKLLWIGQEKENFELCKSLANDYLVTTIGICISKSSENIQINLLKEEKDNFSLNIAELADWADHIIIDYINFNDLFINTILEKLKSKYLSKSTFSYNINSQDAIPTICIFDEKNIRYTKGFSLRALADAHKDSVIISFGSKILTYYQDQFKFVDKNIKFQKNLKLGTIYQSSIYATKNAPWTAVRGALSLFVV
jgi:NAD(P)H-hydrate repair Nnr-like enzyme with NAD(P)H-hydrate epimerase domain